MSHFNYDSQLTTNAVHLASAQKRSTRASLEENGARLTQERLLKQQIYDQMLRLRSSFVREDHQRNGTVAKHMLPYILKSGGMPASQEQCKAISPKYLNGDGRFLYQPFCDDIEKARKDSWKQANRLSAAKIFEEMDADGSGKLNKQELEEALTHLRLNVSPASVKQMIDSIDKDGDGNISFNEFVDGLASNLVAPDSIYHAVNASRKASPRTTPRNLKSLRQAGGQFA